MQSYYVYFWRSREYREAFLRLLGMRNYVVHFKQTQISTTNRPSPSPWRSSLHSATHGGKQLAAFKEKRSSNS